MPSLPAFDLGTGFVGVLIPFLDEWSKLLRLGLPQVLTTSITARPSAYIGDENAITRSRLLPQEELEPCSCDAASSKP